MENKIINLSIKERETIKRNEKMDEDSISYIKQVNLINQLFMEQNKNDKMGLIIIKELDRKLYGYKQQDIKKQVYNQNIFITYDDIVEMLVASKLKCHYCYSNMKIIYKFVRDENQWSLDRINNDCGHTRINTIICCLKCNLKRRCINKDKFEFTRKLCMSTIKKIE